MFEINNEALTVLTGYAAAFYVLMETILKPAMKTGLQRYRQRFAKEPVGEQAQDEQDERYNALLYSSFRVTSVMLGIIFVWGNAIDVSFFDVFGISSEIGWRGLLNVVITGAAIGLGSKGTHFLVDAVESIIRFSLKRLAPNDPKVAPNA